MKLAIVCDDQLKQEILAKKMGGAVRLCFVSLLHEVPGDTDVVMDLLFEKSPERISQLKQFLPRPVFINAIEYTLADIGEPFIRINAWPTFLKRAVTELVAFSAQQIIVKEVFEKLNWAYQLVPDKAGMVSARIIAGVINEAYYALSEQITTREEIDTAMKSGTNYPFGPFEWSRLIGLNRVYALLVQLGQDTDRIGLAPLLISESFL